MRPAGSRALRLEVMKRRNLFLCLLAGTGLIGVALITFLYVASAMLGSGSPFSGKPEILQSVQPETVEQARRRVPVSMMRLPDSAKNVEYAFYAEWIAIVEVVRFEAPVRDCRVVAEEIVAKHNAANPDHRIPGLAANRPHWT